MAPNNLPARQCGAALLLFFMVIFIFGSGLLLAGMKYQTASIKREIQVTEEMAKAKQALLAFSVAFPDHYNSSRGPGHLPCPDFSNDGQPSTSCWFSVIGRLPQFISLPSGSLFQLNSTFADVDRQFWYALSPAYRHNPLSDVNSEVDGAFTVDGTGDIVAVIIAPGEALANQDRAGDPTNRSNYLEADNIFIYDFVNSYPANPDAFNDQVLAISRSEIMTLATLRVVQEIKLNLDAYHPGNMNRYPLNNSQFDDAMDSAAGWFEIDDWDDVVNYSFQSDDLAQISFDECSITFTIDFHAGVSRDQTAC